MIEQKAKMIEMKESGLTFVEIGEAFGISKQRVYQLIGGQFRKHFNKITPKDCIYPNMRKWMNDNQISRSELTRRMFGDRHGVHYTWVSSFLKGTGRDVRKSTIDKYIAVTGLTYEELFARD